MRVPLATQSYQSRSLPLSAQRLVNFFPEIQPPDAKAKVALIGTPGLVALATCGDGPVRGLHAMGGHLYAVSGPSLYRLSDTTAVNLGDVGGVGPVTMADNGKQVVIVTAPQAWVWSRETATLKQITDGDFPGAVAVDYVDGYFVFSTPDSGQFFISALYDGAEYDALDFASAESAPDNVVRAIVSHREIWLFGERTTEVWINTGGADFPFERVTGGVIERGCRAAHSVARLDNGLFWLADDLTVRRTDSYTPVRISTHAIEYAIAQAADPAEAVGWAYVQEGHSFYVLTFPSNGRTLVYDAATGLWHERETGRGGRWLAGCYAFYDDRHIVGSFADGKLYEMSLDAHTDDGVNIIASATSPPVHADGQRLAVPRFELEMETGVGADFLALTPGLLFVSSADALDLGGEMLALEGYPTPPDSEYTPGVAQAMLDWSDDGGQTWSNERWADFGPAGAFIRRVVWRRLGQFRQRVFRVTISDPVKRVIIAANADTEVGAS